MLLSDNPAYSPEALTGQKAAPLNIIGKVVWWGHTNRKRRNRDSRKPTTLEFILPHCERANQLEHTGRAGEGIRPQLDGLRALAMVGVLYVHYWNNAPITEHVRVTLFLVISGFLITHILMTAKARGGALVVRNFYLRRALRLFPALLVTFAVAWSLDADGFRASAGWHLLSSSNLYFASHETMKPWVVAHLWSLNLLEQFYLIWPLVILFLSEKALHVVIVLGIAGLAFVRANSAALGLDGWWMTFVFAFDPILMGALACVLYRHAPVREVLTAPMTLFLSMLVLASPLLIMQIPAWENFGHTTSYRFFAQPALAVLVMGAFQGYNGPLGWLLQSPPARFVAQISSGVYIYHMLAWYVVGEFYPAIYAKGPFTFVVMTAVTVGVATVSWYLIEAPIGRLKRYFPVRRAETDGAHTLSSAPARPSPL